MKDQELIDLLKQQAKEIADANIAGYGNTMLEAANRLEQLVMQKTGVTDPQAWSIINELAGCCKELIDVMEIQEKRETEEFHLSSHAFKPMWDEAKRRAQENLDALNP